MKNATLRQLKLFECVARHLSFTRAANEMHLSQPAVSTQVKELERHAGLPLFEQLGRRVYLTRAGTEMLHYSRTIIQQFREAEEAMLLLRGDTGGTLNIAVISAGDYFIPRLLAEFARRHPGVGLNLTVHNRTELLHRLADNLIDLAIMGRPPEQIDVVSEPFSPHPYVIVAAPSHRLARTRGIPKAVIAREQFVVRERGSDTRNAMTLAFGRWNATLDIRMEITSTETIKQAVIAGLGVSFLSAHTVALERQVGNLTILDVEGFPMLLHWNVVHRKNKRLPPVASAFKNFLMGEGATLIEEITHFGTVPGARSRPGSRHRTRAEASPTDAAGASGPMHRAGAVDPRRSAARKTRA